MNFVYIAKRLSLRLLFCFVLFTNKQRSKQASRQYEDFKISNKNIWEAGTIDLC